MNNGVIEMKPEYHIRLDIQRILNQLGLNDHPFASDGSYIGLQEPMAEGEAAEEHIPQKSMHREEQLLY